MKSVSLNFGSIKDTVLRHSSKNIVNEGRSKSLVEMFVSETKENPILKIQYLVYKNIQNGRFSKQYLAERYLNQNMDLCKHLSWDDILRENRDFRFRILNNSHVESNPGNETLFESIHDLIKSKTQKGFNSLDEENQAYENVINHLMREKTDLNESEKVDSEEEHPTLLSWKYVTTLAVNTFNKRYGHLNEDEQKLVRILTSDSTYKLNYLQDLKTESLEMIENTLSTNTDEDVQKNLSKFKNKIVSMDLTSDIDEKIINLYELKMNLD